MKLVVTEADLRSRPIPLFLGQDFTLGIDTTIFKKHRKEQGKRISKLVRRLKDVRLMWR